jgi:hypothetical protein
MVRLPQTWGLGGSSPVIWLDLITCVYTVAKFAGLSNAQSLPNLGGGEASERFCSLKDAN